MSRFFLVFWLLEACTAWAQQQAAPALTNNEAAFQRIAAERQRIEAHWNAQEAQCAERFAVNDCLNKVSSGRRAQMAVLKREESSLREREREERAALQLQRIAQRAQEKREAQKPSDDNSASERLQAQQERQAAHAARLATSEPVLPLTQAQPQGPTTQEQAQNRQEYQRKLAEAEKRRQELERRKAKKSEKTTAPLPTPSS